MRLLLVGCFVASFIIISPIFCPAETDLDSVLQKLDQTAENFRTAQANFVWTTFNSVVSEEEKPQTGKIYFERSGSETKMAAHLDAPDSEVIIFSGGKIEIYKKRLETVDVYNAGAHREEFETFLVLGFGSSGKEMRTSFDVKYQGDEKIAGVDIAKLDLVPKAENIRNHFPEIILWIDLQRGVSLQQKLMEPNGDYRLAKYSAIDLKHKIPAKIFNLKPSGKTTVTNH
ncbi:MAG TPA: outer membrane lipoprotein carrier protein LolA [Terriglobales bacterium]|nr:outer membrane lipoprotein carrier protein LolA [Terriglobales bacterium]